MMGQYCGRAGATVRDHIRISRAIPQAMRQEFDMLYRNHWRAMLPYAKTDQELVDMAGWWLQQADDYGGKIGSVAALRRALRDRYGKDPAWMARLRRLKTGAERVSVDEAAPGEVREYCCDFAGQLEPWVEER